MMLIKSSTPLWDNSSNVAEKNKVNNQLKLYNLMGVEMLYDSRNFCNCEQTTRIEGLEMVYKRLHKEISFTMKAYAKS